MRGVLFLLCCLGSLAACEGRDQVVVAPSGMNSSFRGEVPISGTIVYESE